MTFEDELHRKRGCDPNGGAVKPRNGQQCLVCEAVHVLGVADGAELHGAVALVKARAAHARANNGHEPRRRPAAEEAVRCQQAVRGQRTDARICVVAKVDVELGEERLHVARDQTLPKWAELNQCFPPLQQSM